ncbi:CRAL/TRIO domain-containing protein [Testicularia cyperi]|uniref:CRAL/TRIO domain-containing protein n=1 Tax=Testicularia cyperi TaxID=1882483 RepID=A0A317XJ78_9BASI|nr:CRAL/TRIO domain-containing protein [Testicularia cyperi]
MPESLDSQASTASVSEPKTPPFDRNATWAANRAQGISGSASKAEKGSDPISYAASPLKKTFASFTRSSGKSAAAMLSRADSEPAAKVEDDLGALSLQSAASTPGKESQQTDGDHHHGRSLPSSRRGSFAEIGEQTQAEPHRTADEINEDSPLQKILKSPNAQPLPGHPGNLTASQTKALHELTAALRHDGALHDPETEPPSYQETQLLRFLRARNFNAQAARVMYLKAEAWKKEIQLDKLVREFKFEEREEVAAHGWRMYFHKVDKLGRPIFIQDLGNMDATNVFKKTTPERVIQNFAVTLELAVRHRYEACTVSSGRWVDDNMMVVNLAGLGLSTFWSMKSQLQQLLSILDNNFPELSGRVQIINAPYMFSTIWSWVKGWLPVATVEKIDIAGSDYLPLIFKYVRKEDWPKSLGGECTCHADNGCQRSDLGPWDRRLVRTADP